MKTVQGRDRDWDRDRLSSRCRNRRGIRRQRKTGRGDTATAAGAGSATSAGQITLIQQNADRAVAGINHRQIGLAITVEVGCPHSKGGRTSRRQVTRWKRSSSAIEGDDRLVAELVGGDNINLAVAVEIRRTDGFWPGTAGHWVADHRSKGSIPVADEDTDVAAGGIGAHYVQLAVAIDIHQHQIIWVRARRISNRRLESSVAVAKQYRNGVVVVIGGHQIKKTVPVQVSRYHRRGSCSRSSG